MVASESRAVLAEIAHEPTGGSISGTQNTTLYLPDDLKSAVEQQARQRRIPEARVIREAIGVAQELAVRRELSGGTYVLPGFGAAALAKATAVIERYRDQGIGVADASIVVLAERCATKHLLTLDRRHVGVLRPLSGGRFTLLP